MRISIGRLILIIFLTSLATVTLVMVVGMGPRLAELFARQWPALPAAPEELASSPVQSPAPEQEPPVIAVAPTARPTAAPRPTRSPTPTAPPLPTREQVAGHLVDLVEAGQVAVRSAGQSIDEVQLELRSEIEAEVEVVIPAGVFFVSQTAGYQNMVTRHTRQVMLYDQAWVTISLEAACASIHLDVPDDTHSFTILAAPDEDDIAQLMPVLDGAGLPYAVEQAAIWIVSDDADYDDLGTLVGGWVTMSRLIHEDETVRALQVLDEAGIDITLYRIWRDRQRLLDGATDPTLRTWLANWDG